MISRWLLVPPELVPVLHLGEGDDGVCDAGADVGAQDHRDGRPHLKKTLRQLWIIGMVVLTGTLADTRPTMMDVEVEEDCRCTKSFLTQSTIQRISYLNKNRDENTNHHAHNRIVEEVRVLKES